MTEPKSIMKPLSWSSSNSFQKATDNFAQSLPVKQRQKFAASSLEDLRQTVALFQEERERIKDMRAMGRIQGFLEAMDQYRQVIESFLNCTPFLGYIWGPIRFILLVANTWVDSLDTILDAYQEIGERLPSFVRYEGLFERNPEMQGALVLYYRDILEFNYNAMQFLSRPGWKKLFKSFWKTFDTQFRHILDSLSRHQALLESEKSTITVFEIQRVRELSEIHVKEMSELEAKKKLAVLIEKLDAPDFQSDQYLASEQRQRSSSGLWIVQDDHFRKWAEMGAGSNPNLFIHGIPGAGKTILASLIVETLQKRKACPTLFFYCKHDHPRKSTFFGILSGLLTQILCEDSTLTAHFYELCSSKNQFGLQTMLEELAEIAFDSQATSFVVLDGLDECKPGEAEKALSWFISRQRSTDESDSGHIRLLCLGQRVHELQHMLSSAANISLENANHVEDIATYVQKQACRIKEEFEISPQIEAEVVRRVTNAAKSMFLFAKLVMENLLDQTSHTDVMNELQPKVFPVNLQDAYERVVSTVFKEGPQRAAAIKIIGWVACSERPLKWREVQAVFFVDPKTSTCDFHGRKLRKGCKKLCGSLIDLHTVKAESETEAVLHLVHDTACHYLIDKGLLNIALQHAQMALFCTEYLISAPFHGLTQDEKFKEHTLNGYYALQDYAVPNWLSHIKSSLETSGEISDDIYIALVRQVELIFDEYGKSERQEFRLCGKESRNFAEIVRSIPRDVGAWTHWFDLEWRTSCIRSSMETLRDDWASDALKGRVLEQIYGKQLFKCSRIECAHFMGGFQSRNSRDKHLDRHNRPFICVEAHCPFQALGFETEAQLKIHIERNHMKDDADRFVFPTLARRKDDDIHKAATRGDVAALEGFLGAGADVNSTSRPKGGETPLLLAARNCHLNICKMLLEGGANINFQGPSGSGKSTALHAAVSSEDNEIVYLLLSVKGILTNQKNKDGQTPLHIAVKNNSAVIVELLLATENVFGMIEDNRGQTPLMVATINGRERLVTLLLASGKVDPDTRDQQGWTPLSRAAAAGDDAVVKLLLASGKVDPDVRDQQGWTPLSRAVAAGDDAVVKLLLASGKVDPDVRDQLGRTPLSRAAAAGDDAVVKLLLASGKVDPDVRDQQGWTPLSYAAAAGDDAVVKLLLASGKVDPDVRDQQGWTPLSRAAAAGDDAVVKLLLATGKIDPDNRDNYGLTSLSRAVASGSEGVVRLLLKSNKFDVEAKDNCGQTPLLIAVKYNRELLVNFLLTTVGVNPEAEDENHRTALGIAAALGKEALVKLLLATGRVNPDAKDEDGRTPLSVAAASGREAIVKLLLETDGVDPNTRDQYFSTPISQVLRQLQGPQLFPTYPNEGYDPLQDYQLPLRLLEQQNKKRIMMARQEQDSIQLPLRQLLPVELTHKMAERIIKLFLATDIVDPDTRDEAGRTPLSITAEIGAEQIIELLLATNKVDPNTRDNTGRTPLNWAAEKGREAVITLLLATGGIDPDAEDHDGRTPLSRAVERGKTSVVQMLLATGKVNPEATDNSGRSPLSLATEKTGRLPVTDYQTQLMLLEQHHKKRLMRARPEQNSTRLPGYRPPPRRLPESAAILDLLLGFVKVDPNAKDNAESSQRSVGIEVDERTNQLLTRTGRAQNGPEKSNDALNDHHRQLAILGKLGNEHNF